MSKKTQRNDAAFAAVIFDLDGTLLNTLPDIARAINGVLRRHGFPEHREESYRGMVGWGLFEAMRLALPEGNRSDEEVLPLAEALTEEYRRNPVVNTVPYQGIPTLLDSLTDRGIEMSILSNKHHETAVEVVGTILDRWSFTVVQGFRDDVPGKPDPAGALMIAEQMGVQPGQVLYVGDSGVDMKTAVAAGMYPAGVLWGFKPREEIEEAGAQLLVSDPEEIIALFPQV